MGGHIFLYRLQFKLCLVKGDHFIKANVYRVICIVYRDLTIAELSVELPNSCLNVTKLSMGDKINTVSCIYKFQESQQIPIKNKIKKN